MKKTLVFLFSALALTSLSSFWRYSQDRDKSPKYIDKANMDYSVKPGDNFYLFGNGTWIKKNPVPNSKTRWGSFNMLQEENSKRLQALLNEAASNPTASPAMQKIGDFYASGMDTNYINQLGIQPLSMDLKRIAAISDVKSLLQELAYESTQGMGGALFGFSLQPDRKNVNVYIPFFSQGGTSLPDRDYYLKNDSRSTAIRAAYEKHLVNMFALMGEKEIAATNAATVLKIETALAEAQMSRVEMRDPYKTYNKYSIKQFTELNPAIDWGVLLHNLSVEGADSVVVNNPVFFKTVNALLTTISLDDWKTYMKWQLVNRASALLSNPFIEENFSFQRVLSGQKEKTPRWQNVSGLIDATLGDLLGKLYVDKYFKPEAKQRMQDLVNNLQQTFASRIGKLDWMSQETKTKALEKLNAFTKKIAYPDTWKDYNEVTISKKDFLGNARRVSQWAYRDMVTRFGKPVDKTRWGMTPPTINAYYNPSNNEIVFPAGILQFPFFDFGADDAVNYGGIGAVIGHEMTHGFDDQGSQFASDGNLKNWWSPVDAIKFKEKTTMVVNQYSGFTVLDTIHVNGNLTLGENLADLGGLNIAYEAFTRTQQYKENKKIDNFTPTQRFFLSWAQIWRTNTLPETTAQSILTDPHSPGMYRANGPIVNMDSWYSAFNVQPGDKLYRAPDKRIRIW
ncbi:MAG: M13 family peptidase [Flavisolibacter sp.]